MTVNITMRLCSRCQVLNLDDKAHNGQINISPHGERYVSFGSTEKLLLDYHLRDSLPDLPLLSASASNGCAFCATLKEQFIRYHGIKNATYITVYKLVFKIFSDDSASTRLPELDALFVFFRIESSTAENTCCLRFELCAAATDPTARWLQIRRRPLVSNIQSNEGTKRLKELMQRALKEAPPRIDHSAYLPTRLIDVGASDGSVEPRLVISADCSKLTTQTSNMSTRTYAALSYCWGSQEVAARQLKTEKDTLEKRLNGINLDSFPKTLLDAVIACRILGIRYLWIDSLCIIQDSEEDWGRESAQMAEVYSNSLLTLCAIQGDSCESGFLQRQPPDLIDVDFRSSLDPDITGQFSIFHASNGTPNITNERVLDGRHAMAEIFGRDNAKIEPFELASSRDDPFKDDLADCAWNTRAWTFQEARCSPRMLLFGKRMSHMFVRSMIVSEDGSLPGGNDSWGHDLGEADKYDIERGYGVLDDWKRLVRTYSCRNITYQTDILPALSAIAQGFSQKHLGRYLAGMWSEELHLQLLWQHSGITSADKFRRALREEQYIAPSWSWASQKECPEWVWAVQSEFEPIFDLLDAQTALDGPNPYGKVKGGYLSISTKICKIPTTELRREPQFFGIIFPYELHSKDGNVFAHVLFDWRHSSSLAPQDPKTGEEIEDGPVTDLYMALISKKVTDSSRSRRQLWDDDCFLGLLLLPAQELGHYRRAGLFLTPLTGVGGTSFWSLQKDEIVKLV